MRPLAAHMLRLWIVFLLAFCSNSLGDYVVTAPSPLGSWDARNDANNETFTDGFSDTNAVFSQISFSGTLTEQENITASNEARFQITTPGVGINEIEFQPSSATSFKGSVPVSSEQQGVFWFETGDQTSFEAFESLDDRLDHLDATWTDAKFEFGGSLSPTAISNSFSGEINFQVSLLDPDPPGQTSAFAVYDLAGNLVEAATSPAQMNLNPGDYLLLVSSSNAQFANKAALSGSIEGINGIDYTVVANGQLVGSTNLKSREMAAFSFTVTPVPEPSAFLYLGLVCLALRFVRQYGCC